MSHNIKHISFLNNEGERQIIKAISKKFKLEYIDVIDGRIRKMKFWFKAKEFVEHARIRDRDPVLNFDNGDKMRVYQSGDSTYMTAEASSKLELHDKQVRTKPKKKPEPKHRDTADLWDGLLDDYTI